MGPPAAVAEVRRAVRELLLSALAPQRRDTPQNPPLRGQRVLVACSGGADSLALAAATAFVAPRLGLAAGLVTVDHGLQDGSAAQAARVAALGYELGLDPVEIVPVTVRRAVGRDGGPEAAAREARYAALAAVAGALGADVLLGHTLDDQAETVLLGLGRGSGPRSIAGMRAVTGSGARRWLRPLLGVRRASTEAACAALGLTPWQDPHNADPSYRRVRLRREVLPLLEDVLAGGVAEALARTAALVQDDLDALAELAAATLAGPRDHPPSPRDQQAVSVENRRSGAVDQSDDLDARALAGQPRAIRARVLRRWAAAGGAGPLSAVHVAALGALVTDWHGQGPVDLPGGVRARRTSGKLKLERQSANPPPTRADLQEPPRA